MIRQLGVLDQAPLPAAGAMHAALKECVNLARRAEEWGYGRYWVAEHHGSRKLAAVAPEVMVAAIGSATTWMRVGSGGVLLPHYSAYKVFEMFGALGALFANRVDLGIGRAAGGHERFTTALRRHRDQPKVDDFHEQLIELVSLSSGKTPPNYPLTDQDLPWRPAPYSLWLLGSSELSSVNASKLGINYAFADFINRNGVTHVRDYVARGRGSSDVLIAVTAICAESQNTAVELARRAGINVSARLGKMFTEDQAKSGDRRAIIGTPPDVYAALSAVSDEYRAEEVLLLTPVSCPRDREESYRLIARERLRHPV